MLPNFLNKFKNNSLSNSGGEDTPKRVTTQGLDIRYVLAVIIFSITALSLGGLYGGEYYLESESKKQETAIQQLQNDISINDIQVLTSFDSQVQTIRLASMDRAGYRVLIDEISRIVVPGVRYTSATVSLSEQGSYKVLINAVATSLIIYLQQVAVLSQLDGVLSNIGLNDYKVNRDNKGVATVTFVLEKTVNVEQLFEKPDTDESLEGLEDLEGIDDSSLNTLNI